MTLFGVTLFLYSCTNDIEKVDALLNQDVKYPNQSADSIEILYSDSGKVQLLLEAPSLYRYENQKEPYAEFAEGIFVSFYDDTMGVESTITSEYAIWYLNEDKWEARNDVVVINNVDGYQLNTEHLVWDQKKEILYTNKFVRVTTAEEIIMAEGFKSNQQFTEYSFVKIKGKIKLEDE